LSEAPEALETFEELRRQLKNAIRRVMEIPREHPHYAAGLIVAAGCEAVGKILDSVDGGKRAPSEVFVRELIAPYGRVTCAMARDIFDALRNGLAHTFRTKHILLADGRSLRVVLNWGEGRQHLGLRSHPPGVFLNLPVLRQDFEGMLNRYRDQLRGDPRALRRLDERWQREATRRAESGAQRGWVEFLMGRTP